MRKHETEKNRDEVEELLRAAQDDLLLKLTLDSHIASSSSSSSSSTSSSVNIDADLERRFLALKSSQSSVGIASEVRESKAALGDDLFARLDALKVKSNPSLKQIPVVPSTEDDEDEDDQVEKLIQWAKDAARLDPSTPSDGDDDDHEVREQQNQDRMKRK